MIRALYGFAVVLLAAWSPGCRGGPGPAGDAGMQEGSGQAGNVALIVFVGQDQACQCTRERIEKSWSALEAALVGGPKVTVKRIQWDVDEEEAEKYERLKPVMVLPGIYFLDGQGKLVEFLQGEVEVSQVAAILK